MSIKAKLLTAVSITLMSVASFCAMAQNVPNVALPDGWSATQGDDGEVALQYSGNKRVKSVKVKMYHHFSVSKYKKVVFSSGNLQYQPSTSTWRFAENQWDYVGTQTPDKSGHKGGTIEGSDNSKIEEEGYTGWIDLYGWGTGKKPTESVINYDNYSTFNDWGKEVDDIYVWRTLSNSEWEYVINSRTTTSGMRYSKAIVHSVNGLIIFPDNWRSDLYEFKNYNQSKAAYAAITEDDWSMMESAGAVFLPVTGYREKTTVRASDTNGDYWSSTKNDNYSAYYLPFTGSLLYINYTDRLYYGRAVRLVRDVVPTVDLGISDGTQWATCNIGAETPWNYGDYYSWGEIETKDSYLWDNYKYANGTSSTLKKYCFNGSFGNEGFTDELTELQPEDDVATTVFGKNYSMPTAKDWYNLYNECYWVSTNSYAGNTVRGYIVYKSIDKTKDHMNKKKSDHVYSPENDAHIFIPMAGYYTSELKESGSRIDYWSSTIHPERPDYALFMYPNDPNCKGNRNTGRSIRPVRHKKQ